jgi:hypothetical protein
MNGVRLLRSSRPFGLKTILSVPGMNTEKKLRCFPYLLLTGVQYLGTTNSSSMTIINKEQLLIQYHSKFTIVYITWKIIFRVHKIRIRGDLFTLLAFVHACSFCKRNCVSSPLLLLAQAGRERVCVYSIKTQLSINEQVSIIL